MFFELYPAYASQTEVRLPEYEGFHNRGFDVDPIVYSGVRFGSDGKIYRATIDGDWQWTGQAWLIGGTAAGYYLQREVISGPALASDAGDLQQMNANLDFYVTTSLIRKQTQIAFDIADDTLGASILVSRTYELDAQRIVDVDQGDEFFRPTWQRSAE
jgi:hypothetical protein